MPNVYVTTVPHSKQSDNFYYYSSLISSEIKNILKYNSINFSKNLSSSSSSQKDSHQNDMIINISISENPSSKITIFFEEGEPNSRRFSEILSNNLKNIYPDPQNIEITSQKNNSPNSIPQVYLDITVPNQHSGLNWIRENVQQISMSIVMSLDEYFGLPFIPYSFSLEATATSDTNMLERPSLKSNIIQTIIPNEKIKILSRWEDWYVIEKNGQLGYIHSKFINI